MATQQEHQHNGGGVLSTVCFVSMSEDDDRVRLLLALTRVAMLFADKPVVAAVFQGSVM